MKVLIDMRKDCLMIYTDCWADDIRAIVAADAKKFKLVDAVVVVDENEKYDEVECEWYRWPQMKIDYKCRKANGKRAYRVQCFSMVLGNHIPLSDLIVLRGELREQYGFIEIF